MINEIRIGSWLFGTDKTKKRVTAEAFPFVASALIIKKVMPIPLREEALMKITPMIEAPGNKVAFHFTNDAWMIRLLKVDHYWSVHLAFNPNEGVVFYPHLRDIEYVHQLQNIVLEVLGIELEIEP